MSVAHEMFSIQRLYGATPTQTFSGFAVPELRRQWFATHPGWERTHWEMDFRVGGSEVSRGGPPGGRFNEYVARFHEIVADERIVYAYDLLHDGVLVSVSLATVELTPTADGGTHLTLTEQGAYLVGGVPANAERRHGTGLLLDALARHLEGPSR